MVLFLLYLALLVDIVILKVGSALTLASLSIEITQLLFSLGSCDIDDIILNVLGDVIDFVGYKAMKGIIKN